MSNYRDKYGKVLDVPNIKKKISADDWDKYMVVAEEVFNTYAYTKHDYFVSQYDYNDLRQEQFVCKRFGCGQRLTRREYLFSDYCVIHNNP